MIGGAISIRSAMRLGQVQPPHIIHPWVVPVGDPAQGTDGGYVFLPASPMVSRREAVPCSSLHLKLFHSLVPNSNKSTDIQCFFRSAWLKKKNSTRMWGMVTPTQHRRYQHRGKPPSPMSQWSCMSENQRYNQSSGLAYTQGRRRDSGVKTLTGPVQFTLGNDDGAARP